MPPLWFPKSLHLGAKEYLHILKSTVKPWLDANYLEGNYCFQQDLVPGHEATKVQQWCSNNLAQIWPKELWPPSSLDAVPLDYGIWGFMKSKACTVPHLSVDAMKASVTREWAAMSEDHICKMCRAFRPHLEAMVSADGSHFEQ